MPSIELSYNNNNNNIRFNKNISSVPLNNRESIIIGFVKYKFKSDERGDELKGVLNALLGDNGPSLLT